MIKVLFKEEFEHNGTYFRGVAVSDGVNMDTVSDCAGNERALVQFDCGGGIGLLVPNKIAGVSSSEGIPADYVTLVPTPPAE